MLVLDLLEDFFSLLFAVHRSICVAYVTSDSLEVMC